MSVQGLDVPVARHWREALDVAGIELVAADGAALPAFDAGAAIDVQTPAGLRAFSLCNAPAERHRYVIAVKRERAGRGGSALLHDRVRAGDVLRILPPRNDFPLAATAVHSVLLAGGIGIAPLAAMAESLYRRGAPFELHYTARNQRHAALRERLRSSGYAGQVHFHWSEAQGRLDLARLIARTPPASELYVCGPAGLIESAAAAQQALGREPARLHFERF